jgi:hypothetical protein
MPTPSHSSKTKNKNLTFCFFFPFSSSSSTSFSIYLLLLLFRSQRAAEQKERISWFAAAIASRARSERDSWAQHRTDASAASRAVCDAWQKALQQWRTHSEQSAERRNRELHGWLLAKYAEEEETVSKGCRADDAARRSARLEREKAEAKQFDHEATSRMEQLNVRRWALDEWQEERRKAHAFAEKVRQSVDRLWAAHGEEAAAEAEAERRRADAALQRAIEDWTVAARSAVRRVAAWQSHRTAAMCDAVRLAVAAAERTFHNNNNNNNNNNNKLATR